MAIADVDTGQTAERAWGFPEAHVYGDYRALLDDPGVNAVEILLPHD